MRFQWNPAGYHRNRAMETNLSALCWGLLTGPTPKMTAAGKQLRPVTWPSGGGALEAGPPATSWDHKIRPILTTLLHICVQHAGTIMPVDTQPGAGLKTTLPAAPKPSAEVISLLMRSLNGKSIDRAVLKGFYLYRSNKHGVLNPQRSFMCSHSHHSAL